MSTLDELPPDQRAALSLLLAQRKRYADVAQLLHIGERAVHDRAHAALAVLAPAKARELSAEQRELVGDYMLGQQDVAERLRTRTLIATTPAARAWALALGDSLAPLAADALPDVPAAEEAAQSGLAAAAAPPSPATPLRAAPSPAASSSEAPSPATPEASAAAPPAADTEPAATATAPDRDEELTAPHSSAPAPEDVSAGATGSGLPASRIGGAIVLAVLLAAIVVGVVLLTGGGSSKGHGAATASRTTAASASGPSVSRIAMRPAEAGSHSLGLLQILQEGSKRAFYLVAEKMPTTSGYFYALWLYNSSGSAEPLGKAPAVGANHRLEGGGALPADAGSFHEVLLTRETSVHASHPGPVVLRGKFSLAGEGSAAGSEAGG
jgi:hypothetical protein